MQIAIFIEHGRVQRVATTEPAEYAIVIEEDGEPWLAPCVLASEITHYIETARDSTRRMALGMACEVASDAFMEISKRPYDCAAQLLGDVRAVLTSLIGGLETASAL